MTSVIASRALAHSSRAAYGATYLLLQREHRATAIPDVAEALDRVQDALVEDGEVTHLSMAAGLAALAATTAAEAPAQRLAGAALGAAAVEGKRVELRERAAAAQMGLETARRLLADAPQYCPASPPQRICLNCFLWYRTVVGRQGLW